MKMAISGLTRRERARILHEKSIDYDPNPNGLGHELYHSMRVNQNSIAQIESRTGHKDSFGNLLHRCLRLCAKLVKKGLEKEDIICCFSDHHLNACVPIISGLFLGLRVAPLDPALSFQELKHVLEQIRPKVVFATADTEDLLERVLQETDIFAEVVVFGQSSSMNFDTYISSIKNVENFEPKSITDITETALILFKSGACPRGVCLSHRALLKQAVNAISGWNLVCLSNYSQDGGIALNCLSFACTVGITVLNCSLLLGMTRVVCEGFDADEVWHVIDKYGISLAVCSVHQATQLARIGRPEAVSGKSLKLLTTTGGPFSKSVLNELRRLLPGCFVTNAYSQAEAAGMITMFTLTRLSDIRDQYENPTSCGKLVPGIACKIVDPFTNEILPARRPGELRYETDFGYFDPDSSSDRWITTGDVGYYDERGLFFVLDQLGLVFRCRNDYILPSTIEAVIKTHPAVADALVIGVPEGERGEVPAGFVTLNKGMGKRVTAGDIEAYVNANVENRLKLRGGLKIVKKIRFTASGKAKKWEMLEEIV